MMLIPSMVEMETTMLMVDLAMTSYTVVRVKTIFTRVLELITSMVV